MKFKVGDRVQTNITPEDIYSEFNGRRGIIEIIDQYDDDSYVYKLNFTDDCWFYENELELIIPKKKPITEVDFLDCFQQNFKDGV